FVTKLKIVTASILCVGLAAALIGGSFASTGAAQDTGKAQAATAGAQGESDEAFIRRLSKDLRGVEPSPAEVHFFVNNKDAGKRQKLVDLFIQERQAKIAVEERQARYRGEITLAIQALAEINKSKPKNKAADSDSSLPIQAELQRLEAELEVLKAQA